MNFSRSFYFWGPMDGHVIRPPTPSSLPPLPSPAPPIISSSYNFLAPVYNKQKMMSIFLFYWRFFSRMLENFPIGRRLLKIGNAETPCDRLQSFREPGATGTRGGKAGAQGALKDVAPCPSIPEASLASSIQNGGRHYRLIPAPGSININNINNINNTCNNNRRWMEGTRPSGDPVLQQQQQ